MHEPALGHWCCPRPTSVLGYLGCPFFGRHQDQIFERSILLHLATLVASISSSVREVELPGTTGSPVQTSCPAASQKEKTRWRNHQHPGVLQRPRRSRTNPWPYPAQRHGCVPFEAPAACSLLVPLRFHLMMTVCCSRPLGRRPRGSLRTPAARACGC